MCDQLVTHAAYGVVVSRCLSAAGILAAALLGSSCESVARSPVPGDAAARPDRPTEPDIWSFLGEDLRDGGPEVWPAIARFREAIGAPAEQPNPMGFAPWWIRPFRAGQITALLLEAYPGWSHPDCPYVRVHAFDERRSLVLGQTFPIGWRTFLHDVDVVSRQDLGCDVLRARLTAMPHLQPEDRTNYHHQYYALVDDAFALIRCEDLHGRVYRPWYGGRRPLNGPEVPQRTAREWLLRLENGSTVAQLAALVWLTAGHRPSTEPLRAGHDEESVEAARLFERVRDDPRTAAVLARLKRSSVEWVREYASLGSAR